MQEPEFWLYSSWLDIVTKYRRARFGLFWLLLPPALYIGVIGYFYSAIGQRSPLTAIPHLGIGYVVYRFISMVITESGGVMQQHSSFILDGHLRLTDFILRTMAKGLFYFLASLPVLVAFIALGPAVEPLGVAVAPLALLLVLYNVAALAIVISLLGARHPDVNELTNSLFIFAFILTPILWSASWAPPGTVHGVLARVNPLFHMVEIVRAPLLGEPIETLTLAYMGCMTCVSTALAFVLYNRFSRSVPLWV